MKRQGDCWDVEITDWARSRIFEQYPEGVPSWMEGVDIVRSVSVQSNATATSRPINVMVPTATLGIGAWRRDVAAGGTLKGFWQWLKTQEDS